MGETEQTTALALRPAALSGYIPPPTKDEFEAMISMANTLAKAQGFLPAHFFGQPYKILAAILYGRDLGISATNALQHIIVIEGKATADAQLIGMLVRRAGHRLEDKTTDQASTVTITRDDGTIHTVTFTMADAQRAGLVRAGGAWTKYPAAMLYARALTACARKGAQDALMGTIYTPEELGVEPEDGQPSTAPVVEVAEFREIPIEQASAASLEAVAVSKGMQAAPPPSGSTPMTPPESGAAPALARSVEPPKSGPRAKRGNVVTAPSAQPKPEQESPSGADGVTTPPNSPATALPASPAPLPLAEGIADLQARVDAMKAKAAARDSGQANYMENLRRGARENAAHLRQLRIRLSNVEHPEAVQPVPEATPSSDSDASLETFIAAQVPGKTLATLELKELEAVSKVLEELIPRVEAKLK